MRIFARVLRILQRILYRLHEKDTERTHCHLQLEPDTGTFLRLSRIYLSVAFPQRIRTDVRGAGLRQVSGGRQYHRLPGGRPDFLRVGLPHCMQNCPEAQENETYHVCGVNVQLEKDFMQYSFSHYTQFASIRSLLEKAHRVSVSRLPEKAR